ncbi:MAG: alpha/beta fold hydrolase [Pseudomonadota bacterium]
MPQERLGWWRDVVCPGGGIDLSQFCVVSADFFPLAPTQVFALSSIDYADHFVTALIACGFDRIDTVVGASFGGLVAQQIAARHPSFANQFVILCAAGQPSVTGLAWRKIQRDIIRTGIETGQKEQAVALARSLALTTYRTTAELENRFGADNCVTDYLDAQGKKFAARMSAERYITLSAAIDSHTVEPSTIDRPTFLIAADTDLLVPIDDVKKLAREIGSQAQCITFPSVFGHDAFLKETNVVNAALRRILHDLVAEPAT